MELMEEVLEEARARGILRKLVVDGLTFTYKDGIITLSELNDHQFPATALEEIKALFDARESQTVSAGDMVFHNEYVYEMPDADEIHFYPEAVGDEDPFFLSRYGLSQLFRLVEQPYDLAGL